MLRVEMTIRLEWMKGALGDNLSGDYPTASCSPLRIPADTPASVTWDTVPFSDRYNDTAGGDYSWAAIVQASTDGKYPLQIVVWRNYETDSNMVGAPCVAGMDTELTIKPAETGIQTGDYVCLK